METNKPVFEEEIMIRSILVFSFIMPIATIGNIIFKLEPITVFLTGFSSLFFLSLYFAAKKYHNYQTIKYFITIYAIVFLNIMFFHNYGSRGPILCNFLVVLCGLIFFWEKRILPVISVIFFINLVIFFYLDLNYPHLIKVYPNEQSRIIDMYIGNFISFLFIIGYAYYSKESYIREYLKKSQADKLKSAFLVNLYGEIKLPLKTIIGYSELLKRTDNEEKRKQFIDTINNSSKQLLLLMNDIFDISLIESNQLSLNIENSNIKQIVNEAISDIEKERSSDFNSNVVIKEKFPFQDFFVKTDSFRLKQIIKNIINYLLKHTIKGDIIVGYEKQENKYVFSISGTGFEIYQSDLDIFLNKYDRETEPQIKDFTGSMLGFFVYKRIVQLLGGNMWIETNFNKGTTFYFDIPINE